MTTKKEDKEEEGREKEKNKGYNTRREMLKVESQGDVHVVVASERFVAVGTLAGARSETFFDAVFAENMTARLDRRVLPVAAAHRAQSKGLG